MRKVIDALLVVTSRLVVLGFLLLPFGMVMADEPSGKDLYSAKCALCHGANGAAKSIWAKKGAPNFNDVAWQKAKTDEAIAKSIREGIPEKQMPSYKDKLKPEEIAAIVRFIRTLGPSK